METNSITATFIPDEPATQFECGRVRYTTTGHTSILKMAGQIKLSPEVTVAAILENRMEHTEKHPSFRVEDSLPHELMEPYFTGLEKLAGIEYTRARNAEIDVPRSPYQITHCNFRSFLNLGHFCYDFAVQDYKAPHPSRTQDTPPENKRFEYAQQSARRCAENLIAWREPVREYIETGSGLYKHNPKWATGYQNPLKPGIVSKEVWNALVAWWLENEATPLQHAAVQTMIAADHAAKLYKDFGLSYGGSCAWYTEYSFYLPDQEKGTCNYDGKGHMRRIVKSFAESELAGWNPETNKITEPKEVAA